MSIDITPGLVTRYVSRYAQALVDRYQPDALYVVDVHGSPVHRQAIQDGLAKSGVPGCFRIHSLATGVQCYNGHVTCEPVAHAHQPVVQVLVVGLTTTMLSPS